MKIGNLEITKMYIGSTDISKVYVGATQIFDSGSEPQPDPYSEQYFTTESLDDGNTISFTMGSGITTAMTTAVTSVSVSTDDGATWTSMENIGANASLSVTLDAGEKAIWKGVAVCYSVATATTKSTIFSSTGDYKVYGNILSLLYGDDFERHTHTTLSVSNNLFTNLFNGSTGLTDASNLVMDFVINFVNSSARPFAYMFKGCTNLVTAPELKDITFSNNADYVFRNMFDGCTSLVSAPELPLASLFYGCYQYMFRGCTSLNYVKCLATNISATNCTSNWLNGVSATGTFVKAASMSSWITGVNGIPDGWTVENDDGSLPVNDLEPDPSPIENPEDIE